MSSAEPTRLTDDLWLAAHDGVRGACLIGEWPLGVGLATGLLAELIHGGFLELQDGELFRTAAELPDDPALRPLLVKLEAEEQDWSPAVTPRARASVRAPDDREWGSRASGADVWPPPVQPAVRHRRRGHDLKVWMSYLAYEGRAERRVIDRLSRTGLVRQEQRRRLFGDAAPRYVPYDSVASGTPAFALSSAVRNGHDLSWSERFLAGLFLATGLHHHAFATVPPYERSLLAEQLRRLKDEFRQLLRAADAAVGEAAMR